MRRQQPKKVGESTIKPQGEGEEDEDMFCYTKEGSSEDSQFDHKVGVLGDIVLDDAFLRTQTQFLDKHCRIFEDSEDNKLEYQDVFVAYVKMMESWIETGLKQRIQGFSMAVFMAEIQKKVNQVPEELMEVLLLLTDFQAFKQLMVDHNEGNQEVAKGGFEFFTVTSMKAAPVPLFSQKKDGKYLAPMAKFLSDRSEGTRIAAGTRGQSKVLSISGTKVSMDIGDDSD